MGALDGKVVLLSGTGRGMGRVAARRFAAEGAIVAGGDIDAAAASETLDLIKADGIAEPGTAGPLDVTDENSVRAWVAGCADRFGRVDVLYNNAGAVRFASIGDQPFADWRFTLAAELDSVFLVTRQAWPHLAAARGRGAQRRLGRRDQRLDDRRPGRALGVEGRRHRGHQAAGGRGRPGGHPGQRDQPRHDRHRGHRGIAAAARAAR